MGGASVSSRDRVEGCSDLLSTVGKELSSETNDSPETSDRAAIQIPCCHGVQREADGIRVSHVSIVADGPFSGEPDGMKQWWKEFSLIMDTMLVTMVETTSLVYWLIKFIQLQFTTNPQSCRLDWFHQSRSHKIEGFFGCT